MVNSISGLALLEPKLEEDETTQLFAVINFTNTFRFACGNHLPG